jgi:formylglycine-generating enzyme required for sulfatase activity
MRRKNLRGTIAILTLAVVALAGCAGGSAVAKAAGLGATPPFHPGDADTFVVGGISFNMRYVPTSRLDSDDWLVSGGPDNFFDLPGPMESTSYWIGETEVTYRLWKAVYDWATDAARGAARYVFSNTGSMGCGAGATDQHPVTRVNWLDAVVWCNALTEYCVAQNGATFRCIYYDGGKVLRNSTQESACDTLLEAEDGKGFHLPHIGEWEIAARYQDGTIWTAGDHVSGDATGYCFDAELGGRGSPSASAIFGDYAWYAGNSGGSTHPVGQKKANALGIKDMCGNVSEMTYALTEFLPMERMLRGGGFDDPAANLMLGAVLYSERWDSNPERHTGFRVALNI